MKNVIAIIKAHGGLAALKRKAIRVDPPSSGLMMLCIECIGTGLQRGFSRVSVTHYFEQCGDLCQDPEVVYDVLNERWDNSETWTPIMFQQAIPPIYREAVVIEDGKLKTVPAILEDLKDFSRMWDKNIGEQGYVEAFEARRGYRWASS